LKPDEVRRAADVTFYAPLKWKESRRIMVCSLSDFFIEEADEWREEVWDIITRCGGAQYIIGANYPKHIFIIPTKRPERMIECIYNGHTGLDRYGYSPNVWFLVSVENQEMADKRIPELLKLREYGNWPVLGLSVEPYLSEIDIKYYLNGGPEQDGHGNWIQTFQPLSWVICGGESGTNARPCHPGWVRSLRDQCVEVGVPFFFKQWGEYCTPNQMSLDSFNQWKDSILMPLNDKPLDKPMRIGKKAAGCLLDGREWREYPKWLAGNQRVGRTSHNIR